MATGIPRPHQWLLMGIQRRQYSYPKARSIASSGRSSVPFARNSQPTGIPRPHQWLLMGVQACRLPAPKPLKPSKPPKPLKPSQGHINGNRHPKANGFSWASSAGNIATRRPDPSRLLGGPACPFARHSQPIGIPRPHQWLLMGVQACRLPAPKPLKPSKPSKPLKPSQGHINGNRHPKATSMASHGHPAQTI